MTETTTVLTLADAERLAEKVRKAIVVDRTVASSEAMADHFIAQVASDLAGMREHRDDGLRHPMCVADDYTWPCDDGARYIAGLRRTAALYGVGE